MGPYRVLPVMLRNSNTLQLLTNPVNPTQSASQWLMLASVITYIKSPHTHPL